MKKDLPKKYILDVGITDAPEKEILEYFFRKLENTDEKFYVVTPNPELLVISNNNKDYQKALNQARISLCDGVGIALFSRFLGKTIKSRITGVDFVEKVCNAVKDKPITVGFLGGGPKVAELTAECLRKKFPGLKIGFVGEECGENNSYNHYKNYNSYTDILFVAFGSPKQEFWIVENLEKLPVKVAIGVGGAFDFISGTVSRAPVWMRNIGFEWFYRLIRQPWRINRQLRLIEFVLLILKERFSS